MKSTHVAERTKTLVCRECERPFEIPIARGTDRFYCSMAFRACCGGSTRTPEFQAWLAIKCGVATFIDLATVIAGMSRAADTGAGQKVGDSLGA